MSSTGEIGTRLGGDAAVTKSATHTSTERTGMTVEQSLKLWVTRAPIYMAHAVIEERMTDINANLLWCKLGVSQ